MADEIETKFRTIVEDMFNRWTALKMAVEHGMHIEDNGLATASQLIDHITDLCLFGKDIDSDRIQEELDEIMDQEFDTICDDNSTKEIGTILVKYLNMLRQGKEAEILEELNKLPSITKWIIIPQAPAVKRVAAPEIMDVEMASSSSSNATPALGEEEDSEWTIVKSKRKSEARAQ